MLDNWRLDGLLDAISGRYLRNRSDDDILQFVPDWSLFWFDSQHGQQGIYEALVKLRRCLQKHIANYGRIQLTVLVEASGVLQVAAPEQGQPQLVHTNILPWDFAYQGTV